MDPGNFRSRVTFERAKVVTNDLNESVKTWAVLETRRAMRKDVSDAELIAAGELGAALGARFLVRRDSVTETVTPSDRLRHDGATWNIKAVREPTDDPLRQYLEIRAAREVG